MTAAPFRAEKEVSSGTERPGRRNLRSGRRAIALPEQKVERPKVYSDQPVIQRISYKKFARLRHEYGADRAVQAHSPPLNDLGGDTIALS
jgi:hypothetical protein